MTRKEAIKAAEERVCGTGEKKHGKAENSFEDIAKLWEAYKGIYFSKVDVAIMMGLLKVARIKRDTDKTDSFVDLIGYSACAAELSEIEQKEMVETHNRILGLGKKDKIKLEHPDPIDGPNQYWNGIDGLNA